MTAPPEPAFNSLVAALNERYSIEREIGRGGMARVYLARDRRHDRDVAIKVLDPQLSAMLGAERFLREIRITAQLTHPNIISLLDSGQAGELLYYVTPFAPGESLRARLAREGQLPVRDALRIAREIADALDVAHRAGIVHRDVKPENVLLVGGHAVVCDFGIARALSAAASESLTQTGVSLGTPTYMSPEQAVSAPNIDARTDIYALGCVLYELLAGDPPFTGSNVQRIMAQHATTPAPSLRLARPGVPEAIERVVSRALAKVPADRFASAGEMRDVIDAILEAGDTGGGGVQAAVRSRWLPRVVVAGLVLVAVAASAWMWRRDARSRAPAIDPLATRIAVLPMVNLSADARDQYLADGLTEELISTLSNIGGLHVIARSSVLAYAGGKQSAADIGRALNVGSLVESTYQKVGNQLRIVVHLVDVATQEQRWTEPYDREANVANIFAIQRDISTRVAQALRVRLLPGEAQRVGRRPTDNDEAYDLYLRAHVLLRDRVNSPAYRATLDTVSEMLQKALALDPSFATGDAELARVYISRLFLFEPNSDLRQRAEGEITRALALDSTLAEAYYARGDLAYTRESGWQLENAIRDYRRALLLKPNLADAHGALGTVLFHVGLLDDARRELDITMMLDPANRFVPPRISRTMWYARKYDSALARMDRGQGFREEQALVLGYLGRAAAGMAVLDSGTTATGRTSYDVTAARAVLLARLGRGAEAEAQIRATTTFEPRGSHFHHAEFAIASAYALLGQVAEAELWLERMSNDGMPNYALLANDPTLAVLRGDPKFQTLLARERGRNERLRAIMHN